MIYAQAHQQSNFGVQKLNPSSKGARMQQSYENGLNIAEMRTQSTTQIK